MKVFWFDCETTGVDSKRNAIIQLAYIVEIDGKRVDSGVFESSGFTGCEISPKALEVNGYTTERIAGFAPEAALYAALIDLFSRYVDRFDKQDKFIAGGYNVDFDMRFLRELWARHGDKYFGAWFAFGYIDPALIMRVFQYAGIFEEMPRMRLTDLAEHFGVNTKGAHDALADVHMTIEVVNRIMEKVESHYVS